MIERAHDIPLNTKMTVQDAVGELTAATNLTEDVLRGQMPKLAGYKGNITVSDISGGNTNRLQVALEDDTSVTYNVTFGKDAISITALEHDAAGDFGLQHDAASDFRLDA